MAYLNFLTLLFAISFANCPDVSGCYTLSFDSSSFSKLVPVDSTNCAYHIFGGKKANGVDGLRVSNPTHARFNTIDGNHHLFMGEYSTDLSSWSNDRANRRTTEATQPGGFTGKATIHWSNNGIYIDEGWENIEGCNPNPATCQRREVGRPGSCGGTSVPDGWFDHAMCCLQASNCRSMEYVIEHLDWRQQDGRTPSNDPFHWGTDSVYEPCTPNETGCADTLYKSVQGNERPNYSDCTSIPEETPYMKLVMGSNVDYFKPIEGKSWCEMLNARNLHLWSSDGENWVQPTYFSTHWGGSAALYPADGRNYLSFWGSASQVGGCCHNALADTAAWGRSFEIYIPKCESFESVQDCGSDLYRVHFNDRDHNCQDYCASIGSVCVGAWDEERNNCVKAPEAHDVITNGAITCQTQAQHVNWLGGVSTPDMLCQCREAYTGEPHFCDVYQDPHVKTWHKQFVETSPKIDLDSNNRPKNSGEYVLFEYGAYRVSVISNMDTYSQKLIVQKNGNMFYLFDGLTGERTISPGYTSQITDKGALDFEKQYILPHWARAYGAGYEYRVLLFWEIPLKIIFVQKIDERCPTCSASDKDTKGNIVDITLRWEEDIDLVTGVCGIATYPDAAQYKIADYVRHQRLLRRNLQIDSTPETCETLSKCCGRLQRDASAFESCLLDNHPTCCADSGADAGTCCGTFVQDAPRCTADSCDEGQRCNFADGYCYPDSEVADIVTFKGSCNGTVDLNLDDAYCEVADGALHCEPVLITDQCPGDGTGIAYLVKSMGMVHFSEQCTLEWYAEYSCTPPKIQCPVLMNNASVETSFAQVGALGASGDSFHSTTQYISIENCADACYRNAECIAFSFARPSENPTKDFQCAFYDSVVPTTTEGSKIFCKDSNAPIVGEIKRLQEFGPVSDCDEFVPLLRSGVATLARVALRNVEAEVADCPQGIFNYVIKADSMTVFNQLQNMDEDEFASQLSELLGAHGLETTVAPSTSTETPTIQTTSIKIADPDESSAISASFLFASIFFAWWM